MAAVLAAVSLDGVLERVVYGAIAAGAASVVTVAVLRTSLASLRETVARLTDTADRHGVQISELSRERSACELRSAYQFATRAEIARLTSDQVGQYSQLMAKLDEFSRGQRSAMDDLHGRVTGIATDLAELRGEMKGAAV